MDTLITGRDLTKQAPHSPRDRLAGFVIASRAADKCRASQAGKLGEFQCDSLLDNLLFAFKGITGGQFRAAARGAMTYEDLGVWLQVNGTRRTPVEIKAWSDAMETASPLANPERREDFIASCARLGLAPETTTTFDWLEADDRATFGLAVV
jgi:hypothetical protein